MPSENVEQHINLKYLVKLKKFLNRVLQDVYGVNLMSRSRVCEWHKRFIEDREEVEDD